MKVDGDFVGNEEILSRFVIYGKFVRKDNTARPEAFLPFPRTELSVTRSLNIDSKQIWKFGAQIRLTTSKLHGRVDVLC
ncbi:MAG: hypothetical protein WBP29_03715, partial [Candidatus Zixiibacteriota bacterium]